jgi:hypothetical protein
MSVCGLLLAQGAINAAPLSMAHAAGLAVAAVAAVCGGLLDRVRGAPWFGWLAYGALMPSALVALGLGVVYFRTGALPAASSALVPIAVAALVLALPGTIIARRRARARLALARADRTAGTARGSGDS